MNDLALQDAVAHSQDPVVSYSQFRFNEERMTLSPMCFDSLNVFCDFFLFCFCFATSVLANNRSHLT